MAESFNLYEILRLYTNKQNTASIFFTDFCDYMQKYARHYLESMPELICYMDDPQTAILQELKQLEHEDKVKAGTDAKGRRLIQLPSFFLEKINKVYKDMIDRPELPYPSSADIDDVITGSLVKQLYMSNSFVEYFDCEKEFDGIYRLVLSESVPPILVPASMSPEFFLTYAIAKVRLFFAKNDFKDFILKKVLIASPGKEISMSNFMSQLMNKPEDAVTGLKHSGEAFIFWTTSCNFAKQDILKKNELTPDETFCVQSLIFIEYANNYYKTKIQQNLQRETALHNLELALKKSPYYFSLDDIARFKDSRGIPLLGQYTNEDLQNYLKTKTGSGEVTTLPDLLPFQTSSGNRYFVTKERLPALIAAQCNEIRKDVRTAIIDDWNVLLRDFSQEPAMKDQREFEKKIESLVAKRNPVLQSLLSSSFLPLLAYEQNESDQMRIKIFSKGHLLPYSELLFLDRSELYTDARIILPFWYTIPILSTIMSLLFGKRRKSEEDIVIQKAKKKILPDESEDKVVTPVDKKDAFKKAAAAAAAKIVRSGSTLDKDLVFYQEKWNRNLNATAKANLEEDINSLIRGYLRKTLRTIPAASFTAERIQNLADALSDTPSLLKIGNHDALCEYIKCYMVKLVLKL